MVLWVGSVRDMMMAQQVREAEGFGEMGMWMRMGISISEMDIGMVMAMCVRMQETPSCEIDTAGWQAWWMTM